jgi:hypothetical protein
MDGDPFELRHALDRLNVHALTAGVVLQVRLCHSSSMAASCPGQAPRPSWWLRMHLRQSASL